MQEYIIKDQLSLYVPPHYQLLPLKKHWSCEFDSYFSTYFYITLHIYMQNMEVIDGQIDRQTDNRQMIERISLKVLNSMGRQFLTNLFANIFSMIYRNINFHRTCQEDQSRIVNFLDVLMKMSTFSLLTYK